MPNPQIFGMDSGKILGVEGCDLLGSGIGAGLQRHRPHRENTLWKQCETRVARIAMRGQGLKADAMVIRFDGRRQIMRGTHVKAAANRGGRTSDVIVIGAMLLVAAALGAGLHIHLGLALGPAIALSIVYAGADNLLVRGGRDMRAWIALTSSPCSPPCCSR